MKMIGHILFVDNDRDFLNTRAESLENIGYVVSKANTISEAEWLLDNQNVHLVILDVRMKNDDDANDISGITFAKKTFRVTPKIILTGFPSLNNVREVMRPVNEGIPPAIDFVAKVDGPDALIAAVKRAFDEFVHINWSLKIDWKSPNQYSLLPFFNAPLDGERFINRAEEFEDLFRSILYEKDHIRINRLLWHHNRRVALVVLGFKQNTKPESFIIICGQNTVIGDEAQRFNDYSPKAQGKTGTSLFRSKETIHYAARAYALTDNDLENVQTLRDLYNAGPEKIFNAALTKLFQDTLRIWHQGKPIRSKESNINNIYLEKLHISSDSLEKKSLDARLKIIEHHAPTLGIKIEHSANEITFSFNEQSFSFQNPFNVIDKFIQSSEPTFVVHSPGDLSGNNILVDNLGQTWLTDFAQAGQAPLLWNYVSLESEIRFDWVETNEILRRQEMEHCLIYTEFSKPDLREVEPVVRKPVRAIHILRKIVSRAAGMDTFSYHRGILFHALKRLIDVDLTSPLSYNELARLIHLLISIAMTIDILEQNRQGFIEKNEDDFPELRIDAARHIVLIGDQSKHLPPQPFKLLQYLYNNTNRMCSANELHDKAIGANYSVTYVHTLIGRIREIIESDPNQSKYLISEPNVGYQLVLHPKSKMKKPKA